MAKQIHQLTTKPSTITQSNYFALDTGSNTYKVMASNIAFYVTQTYTTTIAGVARTVKSAIEYVKGLCDTISGNVSTLSALIGSATISGSGKSTVTDLLGNTSISSVGDGTLTGAVSALNDDLANMFSPSVSTYTPTFTASSGTDPTVGNISFRYFRCGNVMIVSGRFNVTALGNLTAANLRISMPTGYTYGTFSTGSAGILTYDGTLTGNPPIVRSEGGILLSTTASGSHVGYKTGYYNVFAIAPIIGA